ncbi:ABC transporter permease [Edaphobacter bradus]|uniref:ABC transporter permease n=1 Tax=Edaphobacter bradus TaxID=2259016 RepID=UPI0021E01CAB|nr:hypothetical protein [Edaphobacter bradus]
MIWYKTWLESRTRFFVAVCFLALACGQFVLFHSQYIRGVPRQISYIEYIYRTTYGDATVLIFLLFATLLGIGGLSRERTERTTSLTLTLPVSRWEFAGVRATVGLLEIAVLALVPALTIICLSPMVAQFYPIGQAIRFSILWFVCGSVWFAVAFLLSSFTVGVYSTPLICMGTLFGYIATVNSPILKTLPSLNVLHVMTGHNMGYFQMHSYQLTGALPWSVLASMMTIVIGFLTISALVVERQDF